MTPTLATSCAALPPEGALRLRSGKASPAAPAGEYDPHASHISPFVLSLSKDAPEGALRLRPGKAGSAAGTCMGGEGWFFCAW